MECTRQESSGTGPARGVGSYFLVQAEGGTWFVSTDMVRSIEASLDRSPAPVWIRFVDLAGSRIRVRSRRIDSIVQCTPEQRAHDRAMVQLLRREHLADRSCDEED